MAPLTERSQTELSMNTHVVVSDIRQDVVNTHTIVSNVHQDVMDTHTIVSNVHQGVVNTHSVVSELHHDVATTRTTVTDTHTIVSDIHRAMVVNQGGTDSRTLPVSVDCILPTADSKLTVTQDRTRSATLVASGSRISYLYLACPANPRLHLQGPVSDATS